jgi:hypothetical protein
VVVVLDPDHAEGVLPSAVKAAFEVTCRIFHPWLSNGWGDGTGTGEITQFTGVMLAIRPLPVDCCWYSSGWFNLHKRIRLVPLCIWSLLKPLIPFWRLGLSAGATAPTGHPEAAQLADHGTSGSGVR